jgi:hypothetical protein
MVSVTIRRINGRDISIAAAENMSGSLFRCSKLDQAMSRLASATTGDGAYLSILAKEERRNNFLFRSR